MPTLLTLLTLAAPLAQGVHYVVPDGWVTRTPSSTMRVAEFTLPRADGDAEDGDLVLYYFGGSGGSVQANLDRWISQMTQPDGRASNDVAKVSTAEANGLKMTLVDVPGTYVAEMTPGSTDRHNKPGFRLRAAVIETPRGPYFVKLTGPERTIARWDAAVDRFLRSIRSTTGTSGTRNGPDVPVVPVVPVSS
jgi:hypothetical protein